MRNLYREAMWRPIVADQTRPGLRVPSRLTFREVGSVDDVEHDDDVEVPHFGVKKDGTVVQWKILGCSDDTEVVVETDYTLDKANALTDLTSWWCSETCNPPIRMIEPHGRGLVNRRMIDGSNDDLSSLLDEEIWPEVAHVLWLRRGKNLTPPTPDVGPPFPLPQDWFFGPKDGPVTSSSGHDRYRDNLREFQLQLASRGYTVPSSGVFTTKTEEATRVFQKNVGLGVDGRVGLQTWNAAWLHPLTGEEKGAR